MPIRAAKPQHCDAFARRGGARAGTPYIKISEAEIADDYPEPAQYNKARFWDSTVTHMG